MSCGVICIVFAEWPDDLQRPTLGVWQGGGGLPYADCITGVSGQLVIDQALDYQGVFGPEDVRCVVTKSTVAIVTVNQVVIASNAANVYIELNDVLHWMVSCGCKGTVEALVGSGSQAWSGSFDLQDLDPRGAVIGWPE